MAVSDTLSNWRAPRLRILANGALLTGVMDAEVISNNHYAADRFAASVALGADVWASASFWASEPDILVDVQFSLDGGASFTSLVQGTVDSVIIDPMTGVDSSRWPRPHRALDRDPNAGDVRQSHCQRDCFAAGATS